MRTVRKAVTLAIVTSFGGVTSGCNQESSTAEAAVQTSPSPISQKPEAIAGDAIRLPAHDENLPVGFPASGGPLTLRNPHEGNAAAIRTGAQLFVAYNCLDCHGAEGSGAMGPSFQDGRWHFGGSASAIFESIYQGRPDGMPGWGGRISNDQIWMLTAYLQSLPAKDLSTENFTGKTVERTGH